MKRTALLALPLLLAPLATLWALPESNAATFAQDEATPLQEAMDVLKVSQRGLKKAIGDPAANQAEILRLLGAMEGACIRSIQAELPLPQGTAPERAALMKVGYKRHMTQTLEQVFVMTEAALKKDKAGLDAGYAEMNGLKKSGHRDYRDF